MNLNEQAPGVDDTPRAYKNTLYRSDITDTNKITSIYKFFKKLIVRFGWIAPSLAHFLLNSLKLKGV